MDPHPFHLSLVIPHFNEDERLHLMESGLVELAHDSRDLRIEALLVDDGSLDYTWEGLKLLEQEFHEKHGIDDTRFHVRSLRQPTNEGKGVALQRGVEEARGKWILTLDADMAARPIEVLNWQHAGHLDLDQPIDSPAVYIGSREDPDSTVLDKSGRRIMGRVFNAITRTISGLPIRDTQCGFKLYPAKLAKDIFAKLVHTGWAHDVEILMRTQHRQIPIYTLPLHWTAMEGSKINPIKDSWNMFLALWKIRRKLKQEFQQDSK
jgi:dolichyl-phosphate beta-glucosyltransferase